MRCLGGCFILGFGWVLAASAYAALAHLGAPWPQLGTGIVGAGVLLSLLLRSSG